MGIVSPVAAKLSDALFPKVRQAVLGILYTRPERSFYANELIRLAGSGTGAVQRELQSLAAAGIVSVEQRGKQKHYQANAASPIYAELRSLVGKTQAIPEQLRNALAALEAQIAWALLYGSAAKGELRNDSDIDLMVISDRLTLEDLFRSLVGAEQSLGRKINPTLYTRAEFRKRRTANQPFLKKVLAGNVVSLIGSEDATS